EQKMADEKWRKVRKVFDDALRQKPEERARFVSEACGDDKTLLVEVQSLFVSLNSAESFLETAAVAEVADVISGRQNKLETGKCFAHYEIVEEIGAGGMGEVYLAKDKKLDRLVAIKILNEQFASDASNLRRFVSEAKAASALNHPNILTIYEIGEADRTHYIVSEFIKGSTVREAFKETNLPLSEVLDISIQISNALCTAHEARLVHRDIKPENIMIRPDGFVKVLDFGLAKLVENKDKSMPGFEDATALQNQTATGVIMGTVNYMSPEQAKGDRVDQSTDIFSLGVVIYEMVAGRTPFGGDSVSETFANLINSEPKPLARFAANVPDEMQRIISKMLRKSTDVRYQTMQLQF
ncbi:MAG: serine/threonine protein kinase, partial [Acidobacteria bacterium]|nr:serine/threonine protein kinase [Acidobacteriota bacterium]